jgi:predicted glutamate--cysteine ligase
LTPAVVPLFVDHQHYIDWMGQQLELGTMQNVRHLWTSVRPNGDNRPHDLNRLEIRICDLVTDPLVLLAITAFAELRLQQLLRDPQRHDPLQASRLSPAELAELADANDRAAARSSLDASLAHWRDGAPVLARHWLREQLAELAPLAAELGLAPVLAPLENVLDNGNQAMRWLAGYQSGIPITTLLGQEIAAMAAQEATGAEATGTDETPSPLG